MGEEGEDADGVEWGLWDGYLLQVDGIVMV